MCNPKSKNSKILSYQHLSNTIPRLSEFNRITRLEHSMFDFPFFFYLQHFVILKAFIVPAGSIPGPDVPNNNTPVARVKGTSTRLLIVLLVLISGNIKPNPRPGTDLGSL